MDNRPPSPKVAISRLGRSDHNPKSPQNRHGKPRVQRACNNCRKRKVKCTGEQPHCRNCVDQHVPCIYPQARRDRLKETTEQNIQLIALLKDLSAHVDDGGQKKIDGFFDSFGDDGTAYASNIALKTLGKRSREGSLSDEGSRSVPNLGAADVSGSVSSDDGPGLLDEDLLRSSRSRATGFIGQNSEVQWLRNLKTQAYSAPSSGTLYGLPERLQGSRKGAAARRADALCPWRESFKPASILHVSDSTFYLDGDDLDVDVMLDPYELPPPETAEKLFDCYMQTVHSSFPIVPDVFKDQFRKYNNSMKGKRPYQVPEHWRAILNLVLAIGAQYSHLIQAEWQADERDHLIYMTRAIRILGLDTIATSLHAPSLSLIQATGLLSLYYLAIGHVSRAWMMIGTSLRFALAVGLHLRNDDPSASPAKKENLIRIWWSLHCIESLLCALIGRPCIIPNNECTVPLPQVLPEDQFENSVPPQLGEPIRRRSKGIAPSKVSSLYTSSREDSETAIRTSSLQACAKLTIIMQKALSKLYLPRTSIESWERIQKEIASLTRELDEWAEAALPEGFGPVDSIQEPGAQRERLLLNFKYHSAKLLICRPCLCRLERRIKGQSNASAAFNQKTAEACVQAAQAVTRLFPDQPDWVFIYQQSPWWCIVHNIMQAIAVFLLEVSFRGIDMTHNSEELSKSIDKLVQWLLFMSVSNAIAERAYKVVMDIIKTGAPRVRTDISDISAEEQTSIDRSHSFQTYPESGNTDFPLNTENYFPQGTWERPFFNYPTASTNVGTQLPTTLEEQQSVQASGEFQSDQFFMLDPGLQMPSAFGTPFITDFDQYNLLTTAFSLSRYPIRDTP